MFENEILNEADNQKKKKTETSYPKDAITEQETGMLEDMTEGQLADYVAENLSDY